MPRSFTPRCYAAYDFTPCPAVDGAACCAVFATYVAFAEIFRLSAAADGFSADFDEPRVTVKRVTLYAATAAICLRHAA